MYTKKNITPDDIKSNIYSDIRLIVDLQGISTDGVEKSDIAVSRLLDSNWFRRMEDTYTYDEINEWDKRIQRPVSNRMKQKIIESEKVIRYISKGEEEIILISKFYIEIKLVYIKGFNLRGKMALLQKIVNECFLVNPFMQIEHLLLMKNNTIICKSLYMLYRCFDMKVFGDIKSGMAYQDGMYADYISSSAILLDKYFLAVNKEITAGMYENRSSYMGKMNFMISFQNSSDGKSLDTESIFTDMNSRLFEIFINNLTIPFINDLANGKTDKVLGGFKSNE